MNLNASPSLRKGFCIFTNTHFQGPVPTVSELDYELDEKYVVFETESEAEREIAEYMLIRLRQFLKGERDFEDATSCDEYVVAVTVNSDGMLVDEHGRVFKPSPD